MPIDLEYDQDTNPSKPEVLLSISVDEDLYKATVNALPWEAPADGDATRRVTPSVGLEALLAKAPVPDPSDLDQVEISGSTMAVEALRDALEFLVDAGLLTEESEDDDDALKIFSDVTELCEAEFDSTKAKLKAQANWHTAKLETSRVAAATR